MYEFAQCSASQRVELNAQELVYLNFTMCKYVGDKEFKFHNRLICNVSTNIAVISIILLLFVTVFCFKLEYFPEFTIIIKKKAETQM